MDCVQAPLQLSVAPVHADDGIPQRIPESRTESALIFPLPLPSSPSALTTRHATLSQPVLPPSTCYTTSTMSSPPSRLRSILNHLLPASQTSTPPPHIHHLSPTFFLPRAASIEPNALAIHHITADSRPLRRSYAQFADRARGLAYYLVKHGFRRVGILATNTPAFLESIYGIAAAGAVSVPVNYRLSKEDVAYILGFADVDCVIVDREFEPLLEEFRKDHRSVHILVDLVGLSSTASYVLTE